VAQNEVTFGLRKTKRSTEKETEILDPVSSTIYVILSIKSLDNMPYFQHILIRFFFFLFTRKILNTETATAAEIVALAEAGAAATANV
jgi:hypothetical protein